MVLYPPAKVRESFAALLAEIGVPRWHAYEGGDVHVSYSLNWCEKIGRWGVLRYRWEHGSDWFAFPLCPEARRMS